MDVAVAPERRTASVSTFGAVLLMLAIAACGGTSTFSLRDANTYWRQQIAHHYNGVVASGDGRGCRTVKPGQRYSCFSYVRNAQNSLDSGMDVIGSVTVSGGNMTVSAHRPTKAEANRWVVKYMLGGNKP